MADKYPDYMKGVSSSDSPLHFNIGKQPRLYAVFLDLREQFLQVDRGKAGSIIG